eukprot:TRINITY_DN16793_c0_g1_i1.p1 TRINITY_DN16793_c0_g1~~TRINITY_DN16793_c0_g1_i1.p1  ORF type:complete len:144 (-),score=11.44 TRINITY_DN16793_c0_g1_i1:94-525(-)
MEDGTDSDLGPQWTRIPPRTGTSIFKSLTTKGTFLKPAEIKTTRPDSRKALSRLVDGLPVKLEHEVLVPSARRPANIRVREAWHVPSITDLKGRYPRSGTPHSLAYRNSCERAGAHAGWGAEVSLCMSPQPSLHRTPRIAAEP